MPRDATREDKCSKIAKWSYLQVNGTRKNFFFTPDRLEVLNFLVSAGHIQGVCYSNRRVTRVLFNRSLCMDIARRRLK